MPAKYHEQIANALLSDKTKEEIQTKIKTILGKKNTGYVESILRCYCSE
ncbi:MAG: hypothetical protein J5606_08590 [Bacteroidales bacterium]|nr:hypothetical protein [Bacteroidales bacterium]